MNAEKTLKKYIGTPAWMKVLTWISLFAFIGTLLMCTAFRKVENTDEAVKFNPIAAESGEYVYLDIVGVSDWVYKYTVNSSTTTFYSAEDAEGYLYMIELTNSDYNKMTAQQEYWNRADDSAPMPEPYRIYGQSYNISDSRISDFAEVWELSETEFVEYFGDRYINVGSSAEGTSNTLWTVGAVFFGLMTLVFALNSRKIKKTMKYSLDLLASKGELDQAAAEFSESEAIVIGSDMARATANYLFGRKTGCVLRYDDIAYCYTGISASSRRNVSGYLSVSTRDKKNINAVNLGSGNFNAYGAQIEAIIAERNPAALIGNTKENKAAYKEIYNGNR